MCDKARTKCYRMHSTTRCELLCAECVSRREWFQMMDLLFMTPSNPCLGLCLKGTAPKLIVSCVHGTASG